MTLTTTNNRKDYTGNGAITVFAYDFLIVANGDLGVYLDGVKKTLTTDYTVSGAGSPTGGNVTFVVAPGSGVAVSIIREVGYTQGVAYVENQKFPAATHEGALDRLTMLCQQLLEKIGRAATFKVQSLLSNPIMADGVVGKFLRWKTTTELENVDVVPLGTLSLPVTEANGGTGGTSLVTQLVGKTGGASLVRGLVGQNDATTPTTKYGYSADLILLRNPTNGSIVVHTNVGTLTNDIGVAGPAANGRDQAAAFPAAVQAIHFYYIWDGTTRATLSSLTAPPTGPVLPPGYTHWDYATSIMTNATPSLLLAGTRGAMVLYEIADGGANRVLTAGQATVFTAVSLASFVPANAELVYLGTALSINHNAIAIFTAGFRPTGSTMAGNGIVGAQTTQQVINIAVQARTPIWIRPGTTTQVDYLINAVPFNSGGVYLDVLGYRIPNGDA